MMTKPAATLGAGMLMLGSAREDDYGKLVAPPIGRGGFTCRDPEGCVWSIGSYNPWQN
jgi:hypothetical protein